MDLVVFRTQFSSHYSSFGYRDAEGKSCRTHAFTPAALAEFAAGQLLYYRVAPADFASRIRFLEEIDASHLPKFTDYPLTEAEQAEFLAHLH